MKPDFDKERMGLTRRLYGGSGRDANMQLGIAAAGAYSNRNKSEKLSIVPIAVQTLALKHL